MRATALPAPGGEPPALPLREIEVIRPASGWRYLLVAFLSAALAVFATWLVLR